MSKRIIQTKRDRKIIAFLEKGFYATSEMLDRLFFNSPTACRRRLVRMAGMNWIQRQRADESLPFVYFMDKKDRLNEVDGRTYEQKEIDKLNKETKQNRRLFLTQCLVQIGLVGDIIFCAREYTLTSSVADLIAVVELEGKRALIIADVLNRDGRETRHDAFFNNSTALKELKESYQFSKIFHVAYAERLYGEGNRTFFIKRPTGMTYRDYREVEWEKTMFTIRDVIRKN